MKYRDTNFVVQQSLGHYKKAIANQLMQVSITGREGKQVTLPGGQKVTEFINCSYLGLDLHPKVVEAYRQVDPQWGVNFCCARSRFSVEPLRILEEELSQLYRGRAITFPSVTTTHMSVMPLLASGVLLTRGEAARVRMIFDRFAHASMGYLKPILAQEASVVTIGHNDFEELRAQVLEAKLHGEVPIYVADGIYSMGGICPIQKLLDMAEELDFYLYIDDAHGTTIFGSRGEGPVLEQIQGALPDRLFLTFSLTKGFGVAGGGILVSDSHREQLIRNYGQIYAFSAPLDYASISASMAVLELHRDGTVQRLQEELRDRVLYYDLLVGESLPFSPIRMVQIGDENEAIEIGRKIIERGFFVSVVFFPVVPRGKAQLRICLSASHSFQEIRSLVHTIMELKSKVRRIPVKTSTQTPQRKRVAQ